MTISEIKAKYHRDASKERMYKAVGSGKIVPESEAMRISEKQKKMMNKKVWTKEDYAKMMNFEFFIPVDQLANGGR